MRRIVFANLAPPTVGETSGEGIDVWRPGRDREPAGSVCWNGPGNTDFGSRGPGTSAALGRTGTSTALSLTGPAASTSFKAGLALEGLGVARPDGNFFETSPRRPRVLRLGLPRPLAKY